MDILMALFHKIYLNIVRLEVSIISSLILIIIASAFLSCVHSKSDSMKKKNNMLLDTELTVIFKENTIILLSESNEVFVNGKDTLQKLLNINRGKIKKQFQGIDPNFESSLNLYYTVSVNNQFANQLQIDLLNLDYIDAAYVKGKAEDAH